MKRLRHFPQLCSPPGQASDPGWPARFVFRNWFGPWPLSVTLSKGAPTVSLFPSTTGREQAFHSITPHTTTFCGLFPAEKMFCPHKRQLLGNAMLLPWNSMKPKAARSFKSKHRDRNTTKINPLAKKKKKKNTTQPPSQRERQSWLICKSSETNHQPWRAWRRRRSWGYFLIAVCQVSLVFLRNRGHFIYFPLFSWPNYLPHY